MTGKYSSNPSPIIKENGQIITDTKDVANKLADFYQAQSNNTSLTRSTIRKENNTNDNYNQPITQEELIEAIKDLGDTAPGPDTIHNMMIKNLPPITLQHLLKVFNWFWEAGTLPQQWKQALIVPIPKPVKESLTPGSYSPISLTNTLSKIYEKIINRRLTWWLEDHGKLTNRQFAFRKDRTTLDPLTILTTDILNGFIQKNPQ